MEEIKVLNLHGLGGNADNTTYKELLKLFPTGQIDAPQIEYETTEPYEIFRTYLNKRYDLIVGTSFGGFFAFVLGAMTGTPTVLINPCVPPEIYIPNLVEGYEYTDQLSHVWDKFKRGSKRWRSGVGKEERYGVANSYVVLGTEDELLDPKLTEEVLPATRFEKLQKGHRMYDKESMKLINRCIRHILYDGRPFAELVE